jgi:glucan biosynthesis protein
MAPVEVSNKLQQLSAIKFLVNEGSEPTDSHQRLRVQFGDDALSKTWAYEWCTAFKDGD